MLRKYVIGGSLLLLVLPSDALTLGRVRGAALIGQSLDISVPVQFDADGDADNSCFEADVFQGDTRVDPRKVSASVVKGANAQEAQVRIRSSEAVSEPVVTVYLRAGCAQKVTHRYVLLADLVSETARLAPVPVAAPVPTPAPMPSPTLGAAAPLPMLTGASSKTESVSQSAPPFKAQRVPRLAALTAKPSKSVAEAPIHSKARSVVMRPRLKIDPLDLLEIKDPTLQSSQELLSAPTEDAKVRAEAAALWRAINAQPEDVLRDAQRLQTLESDVKSLHAQIDQNKSGLSTLKAELQTAMAQRYANGLVYTLLALLALAAAAAAYFWQQWRNGGSHSRVWWRGGDDVDAVVDDVASMHGGLPDPGGRSPITSAHPLSAVDVDLGLDESLFDTLKKPTPTAKPVSFALPEVPLHGADFGHSVPGLRAVNAEELFDIQQQADFFVSLGQYEQAILVLRNHIDDNTETSALAYLDLLRIYHALNRQAEYERLREEFNRIFNAQVPPFDSFTESSNGLEAYGTAMSRIIDLWPTARVLDVIEQSIFRKPGADQGTVFDIEAYRELLLLYAVAKELSDSDRSRNGESVRPAVTRADAFETRSTSFLSTDIQPLAATSQSQVLEAPVIGDAPSLAADDGELDLDLSDAGGDVDFDFESESEAAALELPPAAKAESPAAAADAKPAPATAVHSNLIDFDLFDKATGFEGLDKKAPNR